MTTTVAPTTITTGTALSVGGVGETVLVADPIFVISTDESSPGAMDAIGIRAFANTNFMIDGQVHGDQWGIVTGEEVSGTMNVFVGDDGEVSGSEFAAIESRFTSLSEASSFSLTNHGEIIGLGDDSFAINLLQGSVNPNGLNNTVNDISNHGLIDVVGLNGITLNMENIGQSTNIFNGVEGVMSAAGGVVINVGANPNESGGGFDDGQGIITTENHGEINSGGGIAYQSGESIIDLITNTGTISGWIDTGSGRDDIYNSGLISGNIEMGGGADDFINEGGTVLGTVNGGGSTDYYYTDNENIQIADSGGDDTLEAMANVSGHTGVETISLLGNANYTASGSDDAEQINGNSGDNAIDGLAGTDTLRGEDGNDTLDGGAGDDTLVGGLGDDTLIGAAGTDRLIGGQDEDTFVFEDVTNIGTGATRDRIIDFQRGIDTIDVSAINESETFSFIDGDPFNGLGNAEIRFTSSGGNTVVRFDADGDGAEDAQLLLVGVSTLDGTEFVL